MTRILRMSITGYSFKAEISSWRPFGVSSRPELEDLSDDHFSDMCVFHPTVPLQTLISADGFIGLDMKPIRGWHPDRGEEGVQTCTSCTIVSPTKAHKG